MLDGKRHSRHVAKSSDRGRREKGGRNKEEGKRQEEELTASQVDRGTLRCVAVMKQARISPAVRVFFKKRGACLTRFYTPGAHPSAGRMAVLLGSVIRNRNLARNHNLECGTHELLHCHHERAIRP